MIPRGGMVLIGVGHTIPRGGMMLIGVGDMIPRGGMVLIGVGDMIPQENVCYRKMDKSWYEKKIK